MKILKVQTATNLRDNLFDTLHEVAEGHPQLVTHRKGDEIVLISRENLNKILDENEVLKSISIGKAEIQSGAGIPHSKVKRRILEKISKWRKQK